MNKENREIKNKMVLQVFQNKYSILYVEGIQLLLYFYLNFTIKKK